MKKEDEKGDIITSFQNLDKSSVLQESRVFNETPIKPSKCCNSLTKVLYLLYQGDTLTTNEATDLFFSVTKLFQSKDVQLRRMVYLVIKELSQISENVMMATSSLSKDVNDKVAGEFGYKSNAIRALCKITDPSMLPAIERIIKQAIVDKDPSVASSALVAAYHLYNSSPVAKEIVKRWSNEVQEAMNKPAGLVQYHALGLLYLIRQHDKMAIVKIVQSMSKGNLLRSPFAYCMLVRFTFRVMEEDGGLEGSSRGLLEVLEMCLRHRHEMVNLEAARAVCSLNGVTNKELFPAVSVLQLFLNSPKSTLRFAAVRTLSKLAMIHPTAVVSCNLDMENLITDSNRSIATFAITTLLKTGNEASVDRLMKQITGFMSEISDEFKIIVVDAIRALCLKFPAKQAMMLQFLSTSLRDEGGYAFKKSVVDGIFDIISAIPESKDTALSHLCEFIEDCEYSRLTMRIVFLLGEEGPKMPNPTKYIRYIYNRTILEFSAVRGAAVSALAKFAMAIGPGVRSKVRTLLKRCLDDVDDEVRDRAVMYLKLLDDRPAEVAQKYITDDSTFALEDLERQLTTYVNDPAAAKQAPFDIKMVSVITKSQEDAARARAKNEVSQFAQAAGIASMQSSPVKVSAGASGINTGKDSSIEKVPDFATFGPVFRSSKPVELTETDVAEYVVSCVKHVFAEYIVFQFICRNTLDDVLLENAHVVMDTDDADLAQNLAFVKSIAVPKLVHGLPDSTYCVFKKKSAAVSFGTFACSLKYISKDCDPQTGEPDPDGYDDTYQMEGIELVIGDYILPSYASNFGALWEDLGEENELVETLQLGSVDTIEGAIKAILDILTMAPCEQSDQLPKDKPAALVSSHVLMLGGVFAGGVGLACRFRMAKPGAGVVVEFAVRSERADVSRLVSESIG